MGEGEGVRNVVTTDFYAAEGGEVGAGAKFVTDIFGESANISAGAAMDFDFELGIIII